MDILQTVSMLLEFKMKNIGIDWCLDPATACLFVQTYGCITKDLAIKYAHEARQDPRFRTHFGILTDITNCTFDLTTDDLRDIAHYMTENWPTDGTQKSAIVVNSALAYGLARTLETYSEARIAKPAIFQTSNPDLVKNLTTYFDLPDDYTFPSFLSFSPHPL